MEEILESRKITSLIRQSIPVIVGTRGKTDDDKHAVVLVDISKEYASIGDPENGELRKIEMQKFLNIWNERKRIAGYLKSA